MSNLPEQTFYSMPDTFTREHWKVLFKYLSYNKSSFGNNKKEEYTVTKEKMHAHDFPTLYRVMDGKKQSKNMWRVLVDVVKVNGGNSLCLKNTKRIILPVELHEDVVYQAHKGVGVFKEEHGPSHFNYEKTVHLLRRKYAVGFGEFGIQKTLIQSCIKRCIECRKPLSTKAAGKCDDVVLDKKYMSFVFEEDSTATDTIWYDRIALGKEFNLYNKLIGIIQEIGMELRLAIDGDEKAAEMLMLKILCAKQIIVTLKGKHADMSTPNYVFPDLLRLHTHLDLFKKTYLEKGKLDLFFYDVNMLLCSQDLSLINRTFWMDLIDNFVKEFVSVPLVNETTPIDFNQPITLSEHDIDPIKDILMAAKPLECMDVECEQIRNEESRISGRSVSMLERSRLSNNSTPTSR